MNDEKNSFILKIAYMTKRLHSFVFEAGSSQTKVYSYCICAITKHSK